MNGASKERFVEGYIQIEILHVGQDKPLADADKTGWFLTVKPFHSQEDRAMKTTLATSLIIAGLALSVMGCNTMESTSGSAMSKSTAMADKPLYDRLGGKPAITAVVDDFVGHVAADNRINGKFANTDIPRLKMLLVEQICQASGGPCTYTGRSMKATHAGMGVSSGDFDALVGDLVATLNKFKIPEREKNELLGALGPMKSDIVEKPMASMH